MRRHVVKWVGLCTLCKTSTATLTGWSSGTHSLGGCSECLVQHSQRLPALVSLPAEAVSVVPLWIHLCWYSCRFIAFDYEYNCNDNILSDIQNDMVLTTGYTGFSKPEGKCSHGGLGDFSSTLTPEGGINKDSNQNRLANHYTLHEEAANVAMQATVNFLEDIRETVGDEVFRRFLDIEILHTSVAFVVDTTASMSDELPWIQTVIPAIQAQLSSYSNSISGGVIIDYILALLNDPSKLYNSRPREYAV